MKPFSVPWASSLIVVFIGILLVGCGESRHESRFAQLAEHDTTSIKVRNVVRQETTPVEYRRGALFTLDRVEHLEKYPCSNCHVSGMKPTTNGQPRDRRAHWGLKLNHGEADLSCSSCHFEDDMNSLRTLQGDTVSYDRAYRVCGQCHFEQLRDWKGGAHGKQVRGWDQPRVIYNCATCHDPHDPAYEKRWPVTYPSVPRSVDDYGS